MSRLRNNGAILICAVIATITVMILLMGCSPGATSQVLETETVVPEVIEVPPVSVQAPPPEPVVTPIVTPIVEPIVEPVQAPDLSYNTFGEVVIDRTGFGLLPTHRLPCPIYEITYTVTWDAETTSTSVYLGEEREYQGEFTDSYTVMVRYPRSDIDTFSDQELIERTAPIVSVQPFGFQEQRVLWIL